MTLLAGACWTIVDDDGTGTTGTPGDAAWVAAVKDSIEDQIHSVTNPTVEPNEIIDEVVGARGGEASLDARLDAITATLGSVVTADVVQAATGLLNLVNNELFQLWPSGDATEPVYWRLVGAGGSVARCGTGLVDTNRKLGDFCARVTRVAATTQLDQDVFNAADFAVVQDGLLNADIGFGAWVRATAIGAARIYVNDGAGTTFSTANAAADTWEWLSLARTIDPAASTLSVGLQVDTNGASAYISAPTLMFSAASAPPSRWVPSPVVYDNIHFFISGNVSTGTNKFLYQPARPGIVRDIQLLIGTAPVGAALIVDVNSWDGAAYTTMCTSKPTIADGANRGGTQPDGTYARRCVSEGVAASTDVVFGGAISIDVDQVGSGTAGANLAIMVRFLRPLRPMEAVLGYGFIYA